MNIQIDKAARRLTVFSGDTVVFSFPIGLGRAPEERKEREGDGKTPEGSYFVCTRNPASKYEVSLGLSYPGESDARRALFEGRIDQDTCERILAAHARGVRPPWDTPLGGLIMIHGGGAGDWTQGCVALDNQDMNALYALCPLGTSVEIVPGNCAKPQEFE